MIVLATSAEMIVASAVLAAFVVCAVLALGSLRADTQRAFRRQELHREAIEARLEELRDHPPPGTFIDREERGWLQATDAEVVRDILHERGR